MKRFLVVMLILMAIPAMATAQTKPTSPEKKYLNLGADPQDPDRKLQPGEQIVISYSEVCDPGWGTGSGKKVTGCYAPNTAYFTNAVNEVIAVARCGNVPSDKHVVTGKVVELAEVPPVVIQAPPLNLNVKFPDTLTVVHKVEVSGTIEHKLSGKVETEDVTPKPPPPPAAKKKSVWKNPWTYVAIAGGGMAIGYAATHHGANSLFTNPASGG